MHATETLTISQIKDQAALARKVAVLYNGHGYRQDIGVVLTTVCDAIDEHIEARTRPTDMSSAGEALELARMFRSVGHIGGVERTLDDIAFCLDQLLDLHR